MGATQTPHPAVRLRANAGRYARLPTLFERYGNAGNIKGNADLVPESGLNADLGVTWRPSGETTGGLALLPVLDAAVFAADSRNLIHFDQHGYFASYENVARARSLGAELSLDLQAARVVHLYLKGTAIDARDRSGDAAHDGRRLPQLPHLRGYLRPELRDLPLGQRFALGLYGELEQHQPALPGSEQRAAPAGAHHPGRRCLARLPAGASCARCSAPTTSATSWRPTCWISPRPGRSFFLTLQFAHSQQESYR